MGTGQEHLDGKGSYPSSNQTPTEAANRRQWSPRRTLCVVIPSVSQAHAGEKRIFTCRTGVLGAAPALGLLTYSSRSRCWQRYCERSNGNDRCRLGGLC